MILHVTYICVCMCHMFMHNVWHVSTIWRIFVFGTYMETLCEIDDAVGCVLANVGKNIGLIEPCCMRLV